MGKNRKLLGTDLGVVGIVGQPKDYETAKLEFILDIGLKNLE